MPSGSYYNVNKVWRIKSVSYGSGLLTLVKIFRDLGRDRGRGLGAFLAAEISAEIAAEISANG